MAGEFTGGSCLLQRVRYHCRQSTKPGHRPEVRNSAVARLMVAGLAGLAGAGMLWGTMRSGLLKHAVGRRDTGKAREVCRVQIMKKFKPVKGFKHTSDMVRIYLLTKSLERCKQTYSHKAIGSTSSSRAY